MDIATTRQTPARADERRIADHVRQVITANLAEALRLDAALIRDDTPFADYGVDSIIASTSCGVRLGFSDRMRAAIPEMIGAANDVPERRFGCCPR